MMTWELYLLEIKIKTDGVIWMSVSRQVLLSWQRDQFCRPRTRSDGSPYYNNFCEGFVLENISCWLYDSDKRPELLDSHKCGSQVMTKEVRSAVCVVRPPGEICHRFVDYIGCGGCSGRERNYVAIAAPEAAAASFYEEV